MNTTRISLLFFFSNYYFFLSPTTSTYSLQMLHPITHDSAVRRNELPDSARHKETAIPLAGFDPAIQASEGQQIVRVLKPTDNDTAKASQRFDPRTFPNLSRNFFPPTLLFLLYLQFLSSTLPHKVTLSTALNCTTTGQLPRPFLKQDTAKKKIYKEKEATYEAD
jgi:hypothetical protein